MKKATIKIDKAKNGYIISSAVGLYVAKDKQELNIRIAETLATVIPTDEDADGIELEITLKE